MHRYNVISTGMLGIERAGSRGVQSAGAAATGVYGRAGKLCWIGRDGLRQKEEEAETSTRTEANMEYDM